MMDYIIIFTAYTELSEASKVKIIIFKANRIREVEKRERADLEQHSTSAKLS